MTCAFTCAIACFWLRVSNTRAVEPRPYCRGGASYYSMSPQTPVKTDQPWSRSACSGSDEGYDRMNRPDQFLPTVASLLTYGDDLPEQLRGAGSGLRGMWFVLWLTGLSQQWSTQFCCVSPQLFLVKVWVEKTERKNTHLIRHRSHINGQVGPDRREDQAGIYV